MRFPVVIFITALSLTCLPGIVFGQDLQQSVASRLPNMERLLDQSSGARQVMNSNSDAAKQKHREARELLAQAKKRFVAGDYQTADDLLQRSSELMFDAIRQTAPASMASDHEKIIYARRKESVISLRDAFNRISNETNDPETKHKINRQLQQLIETAEELLNRGENVSAQEEMDKAYHLLKISIDAIRSGQTLVRSLNFTSPVEEYDYEIDRNDTHSMLIGLLVEKKEKSASTQKQIVEFVAEAEQLRHQAEAYADAQAYEQAIELLEQSTQQLVRAIRVAGIYIPG